MVYTVLVDPKGDTTKREFVETVETSDRADDLVTHITLHSPKEDKCFKQWGGRPYDAQREFDRSRWQEKPVERDADGKPLSI